MRTIHVYNVNHQPYASAAEVVPAILSEKPVRVVSHSAPTDIQGGLLAAIERAINGLRYGLARNIQAALVSVAVLILMSWPLIYNAVPLPEATYAVRIASGTCAVLGFLAAAFTATQIRRIRKHSSVISVITVSHRDDGLLPNATAWRQIQQRIVFPWLGLGLVLFSIALNCVVVADYAHPVLLSDGAVRYNTGLALPWTTWKNRPRYATGAFYAPFGLRYSDPQYLLHVTWRARNAEIIDSTPDMDELEFKLFVFCSNYISHYSQQTRASMPPGASDIEIAEAIGKVLVSSKYVDSFAQEVQMIIGDAYPSIQIEHVDITIETMSSGEYWNSIYPKQIRKWK